MITTPHHHSCRVEKAIKSLFFFLSCVRKLIIFLKTFESWHLGLEVKRQIDKLESMSFFLLSTLPVWIWQLGKFAMKEMLTISSLYICLSSLYKFSVQVLTFVFLKRGFPRIFIIFLEYITLQSTENQELLLHLPSSKTITSLKNTHFRVFYFPPFLSTEMMYTKETLKTSYEIRWKNRPCG